MLITIIVISLAIAYHVEMYLYVCVCYIAHWDATVWVSTILCIAMWYITINLKRSEDRLHTYLKSKETSQTRIDKIDIQVYP